MKKTLILAAVVMVATTFTSCKDDPDQYTLTVTAEPAEGGTAVADRAKAAAGESVTLIATPAEGYTFDGWAFTGNTPTLSPGSDASTNPLDFVMPTENVIVRAEFIAKPEPEPEPQVEWATCNVDTAGQFADKPEDYGGLFTFEEAQDACPEGWRTPTAVEFESLKDSGSEWTTENGVTGRRFGSGTDAVFLPAAGYRENGSVSSAGGHYWSSSPGNAAYGYNLRFYATGVNLDNRDPFNYGFSVRCVKDN